MFWVKNYNEQLGSKTVCWPKLAPSLLKRSFNSMLFFFVEKLFVLLLRKLLINDLIGKKNAIVSSRYVLVQTCSQRGNDQRFTFPKDTNLSTNGYKDAVYYHGGKPISHSQLGHAKWAQAHNLFACPKFYKPNFHKQITRTIPPSRAQYGV